MKKLIFITALIAISLQGKLYAQSYLAKQMSKSKTETTFNANEGLINIRDFVVLKEGRLILELTDEEDYESFRNLDSILTNLRKDIAFYKDSLQANPTGHVRIDYVANSEYSFKKIRFKKYSADGSIFMDQDGDISRLKFEQDTIRIIIQRSKPGISGRKRSPCSIPYSIQATLLLGNYTDVDKVVADKALTGIIDTLAKGSQAKRHKTRYYPDPISIVYNPYYSGKYRFQRFERLMDNEYDYSYKPRHKARYLTVNANIGMGLVRNELSPMGEIGLQYNNRLRGNDLDIFRLSVSPYYFFSKDERGNTITSDNWFVNADVGSIYDTNEGRWPGKKCTFGVGYLVIEKGGYFQNTTFKIFSDLQIAPGFNIVPEIIFTNDCKQIFPGITLKVF